MKLDPITGWQIVVVMIVLGLGLVGWRLWGLHQKKGAQLRHWVVRAILLFTLLIMTLGPSFPVSVTSPGVRNLDILFAVDTSASMGAQDYNGKKLRIEGVRSDMLAIGEQLRGASFSIITFDSKTSTLLPYTEDYDTFTNTTTTLERELHITSKGTIIDKPVELVERQLKNRRTIFPDRSQLLFYIGDGEQTAETKVDGFSSLAPLINGGGVLGYGTKAGSEMLKYAGINETKPTNNTDDFIKTIDPTSRTVVNAVSRLDEKKLEDIASQLKVSYHNRNSGETMNTVINDSNAKVLAEEGKKVTRYANFYWVLAIPFTLILFWEWQGVILLINSFRAKSQQKNTQKIKSDEGHHE